MAEDAHDLTELFGPRHQWGSELAPGFLHVSFGVARFVSGTIALLSVARVLR